MNLVPKCGKNIFWQTNHTRGEKDKGRGTQHHYSNFSVVVLCLIKHKIGQ
jgi:hypothetical protein